MQEGKDVSNHELLNDWYSLDCFQIASQVGLFALLSVTARRLNKEFCSLLMPAA